MILGVEQILLVGQDVVRGLVHLDEPPLALVVDGGRNMDHPCPPVDDAMDLVPGAAEQCAQVRRRLADQRLVQHVIISLAELAGADQVIDWGGKSAVGTRGTQQSVGLVADLVGCLQVFEHVLPSPPSAAVDLEKCGYGPRLILREILGVQRLGKDPALALVGLGNDVPCQAHQVGVRDS